MKILVLGADGMLGHQLIGSLRVRHELAGTVRRPASAYGEYSTHLPAVVFDSLDVKDFDAVNSVVEVYKPDAIVNAVGIVKQRREAKDALESILVNSILPHRLAGLCLKLGIKLVHFSTDCVFSGAQGNYADEDVHDAMDLYGKSKSLGEVEGEGIITLRSSIIGLELFRKTGLVEWFLSQSDEIHGYSEAIYSGVTTLEMARIVEAVLLRSDGFSGIYNVSSAPIDKFNLLRSLNRRIGSPVTILPDPSFRCDRSLDSSRFRTATRYEVPTWDSMLDELAEHVLNRSRETSWHG